MELYPYLEEYFKKNEKEVISITGSGGKTTLLINFGQYLKNRGYSVLLTTTTKVMSPFLLDYKTDYIYFDESVFNHESKKRKSVFYAEKEYDNKKFYAPRNEYLSLISKNYDWTLIEADGSRGLPGKIHTERDPVILEETTGVIGVFGSWFIGEDAESEVFGEERKIIIDENYLSSYLSSINGVQKGLIKGKSLILSNGYDALSKEQKEVLEKVKIKKDYKIVLCSEKEGKIYGFL